MIESELVSLVLYSAQQLGIVLAVGGQTIVLVAYLIAMRDRVIDPQEAQFARAVRTVLVAGLGLIVLSGLGISAIHYLAGDFGILNSPAYLFKWALVVGVGLFTLGIGKGLVPQWLGEALAGGTWYALFFLHILAPVTTWENLLMLYGGWLAAFALGWVALVFGTRERGAKVTIEPKKEIPKAVLSLGRSPTGEAKPASPFVPKLAAAPAPKPAEPPKAPAPLQPTTPLAVPDIPSVRVNPVPAIPAKPDAPKVPAPMEVVLTPPKALPPQPQVAAAAPVHIPLQPSAPGVSPAQAPAASEEHSNLPAIRVMPKGPEAVK